MTGPLPPSAAPPTAATLARPARDRLIPTLRKGTVTAVGTDTVDVSLGGSDEVIPAGWIGDRPAVDQVVSVAVVFGSALVLGQTSLDVWHTVGGGGSEPAFAGSWQTIAGTRPLGFRLSGDRVELCGAAGTSGGSTSGTSVFTLPVGYRPDLNLRITVSGNPSASTSNTALTIFVNGVASGTPGVVQLINFTGTVTWGAVGFEEVSFPLIGAT